MNNSYDSNYWVEYKIEDVLKRLLFFQLYKHFAGSKILPTSEPFSGVIEFKGKPIYVYVVRGDVSDLLMYLKWRGRYFNERIIIITESLRHLEYIIMNAVRLKIRIALDIDLRDVNNFSDIFYFLDESGEIVK